MENSKAKSLIQVGLTIVVAVIVICLCLFIPLRSTTPLEIAFVGTTNDSSGGLVFLLRASNTSNYEIRAWNLPTEIDRKSVV